jgi:hypothetical protein
LRTYEGYHYDHNLKLHWISTRFGRLKIKEDDYVEDLECIGLHMMFRDRFKELPNYDEFQTLPNINRYSGKWNFYFKYPVSRQGVFEILKKIANTLDMVAEPIDMVEIMNAYGFKMISDELPFLEELESDPEQVAQNRKLLFIKKIHDLIWLQYDILDGFMALLRKKERTEDVDKIIIPKPVRSEADLKLLLDAIC